MDRLDAGDLLAHPAALFPQEKTVRIAAFRSVLSGQPASLSSLVTCTGLSQEEVAGALEGLVAQGMVVLAPSGEVVGSGGLSLAPTSHQLRIRSRSLYTWCAEDAVGIPAALGADAEVSSACYRCGEPISVELKAGRLASSSPPNVQLWLAAAEVGRSMVGCT